MLDFITKIFKKEEITLAQNILSTKNEKFDLLYLYFNLEQTADDYSDLLKVHEEDNKIFLHLLSCLPQSARSALIKVLDGGEYIASNDEMEMCDYSFYPLLSVTKVSDKEAFRIVAVKEAKEIWQNNREGFIKVFDAFDMVIRYLSSAVNLYGCISLNDFWKLLPADIRAIVDETKITIYHLKERRDCDFKTKIKFDNDGELICNGFASDSDLGRARRGHIGKEIFKVENILEYEEEFTSHYILTKYCKPEVRKLPEGDEITEMLVGFANEVQSGDNLAQGGLASLLMMLKMTGKQEIYDQLTDILTDIYNKVPLWHEFGKSHEVIGDTISKEKFLEKISTGTASATNEPKVGRNDPCPCGSGKKYKKCCGK